MLVSHNWIKKFIPLDRLDQKELTERFTLTTAEIEDVLEPTSVDALVNFEVAEIIECEPHPKADRLSCCKVQSKQGLLSIVCGAPNARVGVKSILAPIGAKIGDITIEERKLRGVLSQGMLCSEVELGVGSDDSGIVELEGVEIGQKASEVFSGMGRRWELDNKAITHRPDLWGHFGIAREIAAIYDLEIQEPKSQDSLNSDGKSAVPVKIEVPEYSKRYCGLEIHNIEIKSSPSWIKELLVEAGLRPINNVVDITNYVMLELGHPTHAFDCAELSSDGISVEWAKTGESMKTLTGVDLELTTEDLVIRSGQDPVALAGVMGGEHSSVSEQTQKIFLEAAHFDPIQVRKTASRHNLRTDSSARFEKSLDPENASKAIKRMVELLKETCPQLEIVGDLIDVYPGKASAQTISINLNDVNQKLGLELDFKEQKQILTRLGFKVEGESTSLEVEIPSWRNTKDIEEAIDLVEEIGRIAGYHRIKAQPPLLEIKPVTHQKELLRERRLKDFLSDRGYTEYMTHSFTHSEALSISERKEDDCVALMNPLGADVSLMRPDLLDQAFEVFQLNAKHSQEFRCYEVGKTFKNMAGELLPQEDTEILLSRYAPEAELFELRADIIALLETLHIEAVEIKKIEEVPQPFHPARCAAVYSKGVRIGTFGALHPKWNKKLGLRGHLSLAQLVNVFTLDKLHKDRFTGLERFPSVPFSLSLIVEERTTVGEVMAVLNQVNPEIIVDLKWDGNYSGEPIPAGKLSMTFSMRFRHLERTLKGDEITALQDKLVARAADQGFYLREG